MAQRSGTRAAKAKGLTTTKRKTEASLRKTPVEAPPPVRPTKKARPTKKSAVTTEAASTESKAKGRAAKGKSKPALRASVTTKNRPPAQVAKSVGRKTAKTTAPKPLTDDAAKTKADKTKAAKPRSNGVIAPKTRSASARKSPKQSTVGGSRRTSKPAEARKPPAYLAAELGQPVDHEGEPIGAGSARVRDDAELQEYALQLWRQMQSGGIVKRYLRAIERAGLTVDEVWTVGLGEVRSTSSTPDEMRRYKQRLLFRANLLEALLTETIADLHRLEGVEPTPSPSNAQASAPRSDASA